MRHRLFVVIGVVIGIALIGCQRQLSDDPAPHVSSALELRTILEAAGGDKAGSAAVSTASPTGLATLRGRFVISGTPPKNPDLKVSRNADICGASAKDLAIVVTPPQDGGGISNIVVYAEGVPKAWVHESAIGNTEDFIFDQKRCVFLTRVAAFQVSQKFKILNSDPMGHNTNLEPRFSQAYNQMIPAGSSANYQAEIEEKEPVAVTCSVHPWMKAWMLPRENGYFAVTDIDGNFEIPNLPAGVELSFRGWHERSALKVVTLNGEENVKWRKGRFTRTLTPNEVDDMKVVVNANQFD